MSILPRPASVGLLRPREEVEFLPTGFRELQGEAPHEVRVALVGEVTVLPGIGPLLGREARRLPPGALPLAQGVAKVNHGRLDRPAGDLVEDELPVVEALEAVPSDSALGGVEPL